LIRSRSVDEVAASREVRAALEAFALFMRGGRLGELNADMRARIVTRAETTTQPGALADLIAHLAPGSVAEKQRVLEIKEDLPRLKAARTLPRAWFAI